MTDSTNGKSIGLADGGLLLARLVGGGALVLASVIKLQNPKNLMLSMKSFELIPEFIIPISSYVLPWMELIVGLALVIGLFGRAAALWTTILYALFTAAIISVLARGMSVDCGCFGALLGKGTIGIQSILRNLILLSSGAVVLWLGPGRIALDSVLQRSAVNPPQNDESRSGQSNPAGDSNSSPAKTEA